MTTNDDQRVPSEDDLRRAYWLTRMLDHYAAVDAAFDRFLARVRREAKADALREAALQYGPGQLTGMFSRDGYTRAWLQARATEYETGDQP